MKVLAGPHPSYFLDLDAPTLAAEPATCPHTGRLLWRVWCKHCGAHHWHGSRAGHREAHCQGVTPYTATGYNLAFDDGATSDPAESVHTVLGG